MKQRYADASVLSKGRISSASSFAMGFAKGGSHGNRELISNGKSNKDNEWNYRSKSKASKKSKGSKRSKGSKKGKSNTKKMKCKKFKCEPTRSPTLSS